MQKLNIDLLILANIFFSMLPILLVALTSFFKINIVLGCLRQALALNNIPSNIFIFVIAIVLSLEIMHPVMQQVEANLSKISINKEENFKDYLFKIDQVLLPLKEFLSRNTNSKLLQKFRDFQSFDLQKIENFSWRKLTLLFLLSELQEGLMLGLLLIIPFLLIDFVVANLLAAIGLAMLSPLIVSLPLKIAILAFTDFLFIQIDILRLSYR